MINNRQNGRRRGRGGQRPPNNQGGGGGRPEQGNRIDNRARGNASQLHEKYKTLARDAQMSGDRVTTEYYHQFADHYFRVLAETRSRFEENNPQAQRRQREDASNDDDFDNDGGYRGDENDGDGDNRGQDNRGQDGRDRDNRDRDNRQQVARDQTGRDGNRDNRDRGNREQNQNGNRDQNRDWQRDDDRPQRQQPEPRGQDDGRSDRRPMRDGARDDNRGNRDRTDAPQFETQRAEAPQFAGEQPQQEGERPRRQRRPRTDDAVRETVAEERPVIEADRLPPALSIPTDEGDAEAPAPKRRGRPRKVVPTDLPPAA